MLIRQPDAREFEIKTKMEPQQNLHHVGERSQVNFNGSLLDPLALPSNYFNTSYFSINQIHGQPQQFQDQPIYNSLSATFEPPSSGPPPPDQANYQLYPPPAANDYYNQYPYYQPRALSPPSSGYVSASSGGGYPQGGGATAYAQYEQPSVQDVPLAHVAPFAHQGPGGAPDFAQAEAPARQPLPPAAAQTNRLAEPSARAPQTSISAPHAPTGAGCLGRGPEPGAGAPTCRGFGEQQQRDSRRPGGDGAPAAVARSRPAPLGRGQALRQRQRSVIRRLELVNKRVALVGGLVTRRKNATRETTATLKDWLDEHGHNPYPTKGEKIMLSIITKMSLTQVSTWFANARRRMKKENKAQWVGGAPTPGNPQTRADGATSSSLRLFMAKHQRQLAVAGISTSTTSGGSSLISLSGRAGERPRSLVLLQPIAGKSESNQNAGSGDQETPGGERAKLPEQKVEAQHRDA